MAKKKEEVPDYTDGTWWVPPGKSDYEKKPEETKEKPAKKEDD